MSQAIHYTAAVSKWIHAGRPTRTQEEINQILADHCNACRWQLGGYCRHRHCGCRTNAKPKPLDNKIAMGTEHCPIGLW